MSEQENQNGQGVGPESTQGVESGASPTPPAQPSGQESAQSAVNAPVEKVPFDQREETREYRERQEKKWRRDSEKEWGERESRLRQEFQSEMSKLNRGTQGKQLPDEQRRAIMEAASLLSQDPEARKVLGLDSLDEMRQKLESYENSRTQDTYRAELNSVAEKYAKEYGYDKEDLAYDLEKHRQSDPILSLVPMSPGLMAKVARDFFSDKYTELAERSANLKLINEKKSKSGLMSNRPASGSSQEVKAPTNWKEQFAKIRREEEARGATIG